MSMAQAARCGGTLPASRRPIMRSAIDSAAGPIGMWARATWARPGCARNVARVSNEELAEILAPAPRIDPRRARDLAGDLVEHQPVEVVAVLHVRVERGGSGIELLGDSPHRHGFEPLGAQHRQGGVDHGALAQRRLRGTIARGARGEMAGRRPRAKCTARGPRRTPFAIELRERCSSRTVFVTNSVRADVGPRARRRRDAAQTFHLCPGRAP